MSIQEMKDNWILKKLNSPLFKKTQVEYFPYPLGAPFWILRGRLMSVAAITEALSPPAQFGRHSRP